jgi:hypothetical protein
VVLQVRRFLDRKIWAHLTPFKGIIGASICYPMDMVKTRLQNQKTLPGGQRLYNNSIDCFKKILQAEGPRGLYRGLPAQLVSDFPSTYAIFLFK